MNLERSALSCGSVFVDVFDQFRLCPWLLLPVEKLDLLPCVGVGVAFALERPPGKTNGASGEREEAEGGDTAKSGDFPFASLLLLLPSMNRAGLPSGVILGRADEREPG